jgi:peptidoglycan/LPS O-acetylase OafA/YrhL
LERFAGFAQWRRALALGDASYALYLSHTAVLPIFAMVLARAGVAGPGAMIGMVAGAIVVGVMSHRYIERPLLRAARHVLARPARTLTRRPA